jgi:hypothetical protein
MPVGVEPTFSTCCAEAGKAAAMTEAAMATWTRRFKDIALPPVGEAERSSAILDEKVADKAVQAYFHQYEIVVTFPKSLQAVFMHMKEAD